MEIEVNRVYAGQVRRKLIYYGSIESIEEADPGYTEVTLTLGEKMLIEGDYNQFIEELDKRKKELEDEARNKDLLGGN